MPDIQTKDVYTNTTNKNLVGMSYEELYRYAEEEAFFDKNRLTKLYPNAKYNKVEGEQFFFFDYNKVDDLVNTLRKMDFSNKNTYLNEIEKYEMNSKIDVEERKYISIDFDYKNEMKHEEIELGKSINVYYKEPETASDKKLINDIKNNAFFKALDLDNMKFAVSENGEKGVSIDNVFYNEKFINHYLEKYPNETDSSYHKDPKADEVNRIKAIENQKRAVQFEL